jgi:hypothetical protein
MIEKIDRFFGSTAFAYAAAVAILVVAAAFLATDHLVGAGAAIATGAPVWILHITSKVAVLKRDTAARG